VPHEDVANRFIANGAAQFGQFAGDLGVAPIGILACQPDN
jgi:hypothetical protein